MAQIWIGADKLEHIHYFCGNVEVAADLVAAEPQRVTLYTATVALVRAYAAIADDLEAAKYTAAEIVQVKKAVQRYVDLREIIRKASGETIDLKAYEADMRHLIDTYIEADEPRPISAFGDVPLMELIVKAGMADAVDSLPGAIKGNKDAVAETIANNVRSKIIQEHLNNPAYYDRMSNLLAEVIADLKAKRLDYEAYLQKIAELARRVQGGHDDGTPATLRTRPWLRAVHDNLTAANVSMAVNAAQEPAAADAHATEPKLALALAIDAAVRRVRQSDWRGNQARENLIKHELWLLLGQDVDEANRIFRVIEAQQDY